MREMARPRRVLMIVTWSLADDTGYTVNARRTIQALSALGHDVGVLQVLHSPHSSLDRPVQGSGHVWTVRNVPDRAPAFLYSAMATLRDAAIKRVVTLFKPDIVHARGTRAGSLAARTVQAMPTVLDVRGDVVAETSGQTGDVKAARMLEIEREAFASPAAFVFVSHAMAAWADKRFPWTAGKPSAVVPCSVDATTVASVAHRGFHVAYAGGLQSYQPPALVFAELERVRRLTDADRVSVWTLDNTDDVLAVRDRVCPQAHVESLPASDVMSALSTCDLGVIPRPASDVNAVACPTKLAEYLAAGVPVAIGPALSEWCDLVVSQGIGFSLADDDEAIASFGERIRNDRAAFAERCRSVAVREFSMHGGALRLSELYEQVLASGAR